MSIGVPAGIASSALTLGALEGGLGAALSGHNVLKGALMGGAMGGLGNMLHPAAQAAQGAMGAAGAAGAAPSIGKAMSQAELLAQAGDGLGGPALGAAARAVPSASMATMPAATALKAGSKNILPLLALGGLGLAMGSPKATPVEEAENRNPNAGKEVMDPRLINAPPPGYGFGGGGGEWMFFDPKQTTGAYHYADGGQVAAPPMYDPAQFAGLFQRPHIAAPSPMHAYGGSAPPQAPGPAMQVTAPPPPANPQTPSIPGVDMNQFMSPYAGLHLDQLGLSLPYARGGFVEGPGDGRSDSVPATVNGRQPAKLSDGEYVLPAHVVSAIGSGSSKAGARKLDKMVKGIAR
jgi:hypothetical protein